MFCHHLWCNLLCNDSVCAVLLGQSCDPLVSQRRNRSHPEMDPIRVSPNFYFFIFMIVLFSVSSSPYRNCNKNVSLSFFVRLNWRSALYGDWPCGTCGVGLFGAAWRKIVYPGTRRTSFTGIIYKSLHVEKSGMWLAEMWEMREGGRKKSNPNPPISSWR